MENKNVILYFSGTKNSLMAAKIIEEEMLIKNQGKCVIIPISQFNTKENIEADSLGIICPVYWFGVPCIVRETISRLKIHSGTYVYTVVTMGSYAGNALPEMKKLLEQTGSTLSYGGAVKFPDNYATLLGQQNPKKHEQILQDASCTLKRIASDICEHKENKIPRFHKFLDFLFSSHRSTLRKQDKKFNVDESCTGCGLCQKKCPVQNIRMEDGTPKWLNHCEFCVSCISNCPENAIQIGKKTKGKPRYQNSFSEK